MANCKEDMHKSARQVLTINHANYSWLKAQEREAERWLVLWLDVFGGGGSWN